MKRWEQERKKKLHDQKVRNAKPTIKHPSAAVVETQIPNFQGESLMNSNLYRVLKSFSLQQYAKKLEEMGYAENPAALAYMDDKKLEEVYSIIKVLPGHKSRFGSMLELLRQIHAKPLSSSSSRRSSSRSKRTHRTQEKHPSTHQLKETVQNIHFEEDVLDLVDEDEEAEKLRKELEEAQAKISELQEKLQPPDSPEVPKPKLDPFVEFPERFKQNEVGVSYDSSKLRSTLHHIDIEEMSRCLSRVLKKLIEHSLQVEENRNTEPELRESLSSMPDFLGEPLKDTLRSRMSSLSGFSSATSLEYSQDSLPAPTELNPISERSVECSPAKEAGDLKVPHTIKNLFDLEFNDPNCKEGNAPSEEEIYNIAKNVLVRSKMEKECIIISLIYLERLIEKTGLYLNSQNWKRLLFTSLVIASKVWDDESYENANFAQVFTNLTLKEINSMESAFLSLIDFEVGIKNSEYAKYYFVMREHSQTNNRSFPLKPLDVETVRQLQKNANNAQTQLKEIHSEALHKTL